MAPELSRHSKAAPASPVKDHAGLALVAVAPGPEVHGGAAWAGTERSRAESEGGGLVHGLGPLARRALEGCSRPLG